MGARSCCKNRYLVTLTFATLERNRGSRAQTHKNSMLFDSLLLRQDRCLSSSHLSCLNSRHLSCLNRRHLSCLNRRRDSHRPPARACGQSQAWSQGLPASPWPGPSPVPNVGSGPNHQKWPESGPESTVWPETLSRSMPGPFRSLWDGSNPLQGAVPGEKNQKVCPSRPRISRSIHNPW